MEEAIQPSNPIDMGNEDVKRRKKKKCMHFKYVALTRGDTGSFMVDVFKWVFTSIILGGSCY